jgi:hypothetical protein
MNLEHTYWNSNGLFSNDTITKLDALIPSQGKVVKPRINKALEKYRKASQAYYDLYNNGLYNRAREFREVFGISSSKYIFKRPNGRGTDFTQELVTLTESAMDKIVDLACIEQNIKSEVSL